MSEIKRTKIIATLGPASSDHAMLKKMIEQGLDMVRLNFSHGTADDHTARIQLVRRVSEELNRTIGILADLQGPKIRVARFREGKVQLNVGEPFILAADMDPDVGDEGAVGIDYKDLPNDVSPGDELLLNDGLIVLKVEDILDNTRIHCTVLIGGELSNHKGINRRGGGLSAKALTDKDRADLKTACALGVDYIAVSFPRSAEDMEEAKQLIAAEKANVGVIAKIERKEAVDALDEIIRASDGIMVARGDLAVEIGDAEVPAAQKEMIHRARALNKPVITATQMMESMITSPMPTRAEVSDVANAVLDATDAVMLSAETATGNHPDVTISAMARVCVSAEKSPLTQVSKHRVECEFERVDEAIAMATVYTANHLQHIKAIVALTESGLTPLWMSRIRSPIPIYALSRHEKTRGRMTLYRSVFPIPFDVSQFDRIEVKRAAINTLVERGLLQTGDRVILTKGDLMGQHGATNALKVITVGDEGV
ncbi:MAG: pyruvate kinase [marine bacterium B5-7]|nr:MAG: pyruvate kinase [marine bacterium B5-7]